MKSGTLRTDSNETHAENDDNWTISSLLGWTEGYFRRRGIETPRLDAELLLASALRMESRLQLYLFHDRPVNAEERSRYRELVKRRGSWEPVAYLTGSREFYTLNLRVDNTVLVPRPDTETLVDAVIQHIRKIRPEDNSDENAIMAIDLGCGSGALALAVKKFTGVKVKAMDLSFEACRMTLGNANLNNLDIEVICGDMMNCIKSGSADVIMSNPPYVRSDYLDRLQMSRSSFSAMAREIAHEPRMALDGGRDGLLFYRAICRMAPEILRPGGALFLEIGHGQIGQVRSIMEECGLRCGGVYNDLSGKERVLCGYR